MADGKLRLRLAVSDMNSCKNEVNTWNVESMSFRELLMYNLSRWLDKTVAGGWSSTSE